MMQTVQAVASVAALVAGKASLAQAPAMPSSSGTTTYQFWFAVPAAPGVTPGH